MISKQTAMDASILAAAPAIAALLRDMREFIAAERRLLLQSLCVVDADQNPVLSSLTAQDLPHVEPFDALISRCDAFLGDT